MTLSWSGWSYYTDLWMSETEKVQFWNCNQKFIVNKFKYGIQCSVLQIAVNICFEWKMYIGSYKWFKTMGHKYQHWTTSWSTALSNLIKASFKLVSWKMQQISEHQKYNQM